MIRCVCVVWVYVCDMSMWLMWHDHWIARCQQEHHEWKNANRYIQHLENIDWDDHCHQLHYPLLDPVKCRSTMFELIVRFADGDLSEIPALQSLSFDRGSVGCVQGELQSPSLKKLNLWFHCASEQDDAVETPALILDHLPRLLCLHLYYSHTGERVSPKTMLTTLGYSMSNHGACQIEGLEGEYREVPVHDSWSLPPRRLGVHHEIWQPSALLCITARCSFDTPRALQNWFESTASCIFSLCGAQYAQTDKS